ncbi:MAG: NTP transferase domain-containing protein, partial [Pseudomonadota bacterium]
MEKLIAVVLAAGKGTRMKSPLPKVMHKLGGLSLLGHVCWRLSKLNPQKTIIVSPPGQGALFAEEASRWVENCSFIEQHQRLGTGHATRLAVQSLTAEEVTNDVRILVVYGDTPLLESSSMQFVVNDNHAVSVLGFKSDDPNSYGRFMFDSKGALRGIVEAANLDQYPEIKQDQNPVIYNSGVMAFDLVALDPLLKELKPSPPKGEIYLTDLIASAYQNGLTTAYQEASFDQLQGANDFAELSKLEKTWQNSKRHDLMRSGVYMLAPETIWFHYDSEIASGVYLESNIVFGPKVKLHAGVHIKSFSHIEGAEIDTHAVIGPYARIRPDSKIGKNVHIGNFVEIKNAHFADGVKANHLAYLGDCHIGALSNIGAGTIHSRALRARGWLEFTAAKVGA